MPNTVEKPRSATVTLKLDASHRERLKALAHSKRRSAHHLMKEAIERYLTVEEAQEAILKSVDAAAFHFEATGLHVTHDEVKAWANGIPMNRNAQLPACHA